MLSTILLLSASFAFTSAASAQDAPRQLGAHVHGAAELAVAVDRDTGALLAELSGAAYNFYGFERAVENPEEQALVDAANARLQAGGLIAFPSGAGCSLVETTIDGGPGGSDDHDHHDHGHEHDDHGHDHDDHGHEHEHDDHGHGNGEHGHSHGEPDHDHDHREHSHSDVVISWTYACAQPAAVDQIDAGGLFEAFSQLERLNAQFFDGVEAAAGELTRDRAVLQAG